MQQYEDIMNLPHHVSQTHPPMSIANRAAQFAPFAALTGYEDAVKETARLTDQRMELDENQKAQLDERLMIVCEVLRGNLTLPKDVSRKIKVTYFVKDEKKAGGSYATENSEVKKIDTFSHNLVMDSGVVISILDIIDLEGELFYTVF